MLIVEDDELVGRFLADNLAADGYEPLCATTLAQARPRLTASVDLLLLDLSLAVIVLSGRAGELDRVRGLERGADDYLVKPSTSLSVPRARAARLSAGYPSRAGSLAAIASGRTCGCSRTPSPRLSPCQSGSQPSGSSPAGT